MTTQFKHAFIVALSSCAVVALALLSSRERQVVRQKPLSVKALAADQDDPNARIRYEWMMLRDPRTGQIPRDMRRKELAFASTLPTRETSGILQKGQSVSVASWSPRGPYNVGGRTRALAIDRSEENIILAGGVSGGMWRSTDAGATWTRTSNLSLDVQSVTCLAQDTRSGKMNIWYYGTGELAGNSASGGAASYRGDGIFKSTDGGLTWNVLASTATNLPQTFDNFFDYVWNVVTDPSNSSQDEVYAATYGRIYRSTDGGIAWAFVLGTSSSPYSPYTDVAITATGVVYATLGGSGAQDGIYRSTDGLTWTRITPLNWPSTYRRIVVGIAPSNQNIVYFLADTPGGGLNDHSLWKYTYVSGDGSGSGGVWENWSANIPAFGQPVGDFDSQSSYDLHIKVKPDNPNVVLIGGTNLYRSTDGFATSSNTRWIGGYATANDISEYANHHPDQHSLEFLRSNPNVVVSGHDGGIRKTNDILASTVSWTTLNNGYHTAQFYTAAIDEATSGNDIIIGGMQDNGTWFTNSASATVGWTDLLGGDGAYCAIADNRSSYYVSSQNGVVYRLLLTSSGNLADWTRVDPAGATGYLFINPFVLNPNDQKQMFLAGGRSIWRNTDLTAIPMNSNSKTTVNWDSLAVSYVTSGTIAALAVSKTPAHRLYYGTSDGFVFRIDNVNSGTPSTRTNVTSSSFPTGTYVSCIALDPTNADNAIVVFSNYNVQSLFYTFNGGASWSAVGGNLEQNQDGSGNGPSCRWATILPVGSSTMYFVGTSTGVYSTSVLNGSSTVWEQEGASEIGRVVVAMLISRPTDGRVVAATHANGVYAATIGAAPSDVEIVRDVMPREFALHQNYPNPFNPSTTIRYSLPTASKVKLVIFDVMGREIATLINEEQSAGVYQATWNATTSRGGPVSSGVYFYRLEAGGYSQVQKMIVLR